MSPLQLLPRVYTLPEFLAMEAASEQRHEYLEGRVFVTEYDTLAQNLTKSNLIAALRPVVRQRGGQVFSTSVQLEAQAGRKNLYPVASLLVLLGAEEGGMSPLWSG